MFQISIIFQHFYSLDKLLNNAQIKYWGNYNKLFWSNVNNDEFGVVNDGLLQCEERPIWVKSVNISDIQNISTFM